MYILHFKDNKYKKDRNLLLLKKRILLRTAAEFPIIKFPIIAPICVHFCYGRQMKFDIVATEM